MIRAEVLGTVAKEYLDKGWHVVPLPVGRKYPPPDGTTGADGTDLTIQEVIDQLQDGSNLGLRMPDGVIGIDVDDYVKGTIKKIGATTLLATEIRLRSPLPSSPRLTARDDLFSGIRFFRVPPGVELGIIGRDVDTIRRGWRYAVASPSLNPLTGTPYQWLDGDGNRCDPPDVRELPWLPQAWIDEFPYNPSSHSTKVRSSAVHGAALLELAERWLDALPMLAPDEESCFDIAEAGAIGLAAAQRRGPTGQGRQDMLKPLLRLCRHAEAGCRGVRELIVAMKESYQSLPEGDDHEQKFLHLLGSTVDRLGGHDEWHCPHYTATDMRVLTDWAQEAHQPVASVATGGGVTAPPGSGTDTEPDPALSRLRNGADVVRNTTIPWLIEGAIHTTGLGQFVAPENTGKSIMAVDLALSIANKFPAWAGYDIRRTGPVVYCAMEGGPVVQSYISAWLHNHPGTDLDDFYLLDEEELDLSSTESVQRLLRDIYNVEIKPVLIVFDTQIDVTGAVDEMSPEIGQLLACARRMLVGLGCFGLLLHHPPYNEKRGRGSTSVRGKADVLAFVDKSAKRIEWQKVKGAKTPGPVSFEISPSIGHPGPVVTYPGAPGLSELARTPAAEAGYAAVAKNEATKSAILEILEGDSPSMMREKKPTRGWNNTELIKALEGYASRPVEDGGPREVHTHKNFVGPLLDALHTANQIIDHTESWRSGMARQWALTSSEAPGHGPLP